MYKYLQNATNWTLIGAVLTKCDGFKVLRATQQQRQIQHVWRGFPVRQPKLWHISSGINMRIHTRRKDWSVYNIFMKSVWFINIGCRFLRMFNDRESFYFGYRRVDKVGNWLISTTAVSVSIVYHRAASDRHEDIRHTVAKMDAPDFEPWRYYITNCSDYSAFWQASYMSFDTSLPILSGNIYMNYELPFTLRKLNS